MEFHKCDECSKEMEYGLVPIEISFGYGSPLDNLRVEFCSFVCAINYLEKERKKEKK